MSKEIIDELKLIGQYFDVSNLDVYEQKHHIRFTSIIKDRSDFYTNKPMKELTNLELLMEYMEQNQYFIGNDLLAKYNELLQKEKKEQLTLTDVVRTLVCVDGVLPNLTEGKEYEMLVETNRHYNLIDDNGNDVLIGKSYMRELKQAN